MGLRTLLLVHSPLVGPRSWEPTANEMRARGRQVVVPSLVEAVALAPPRYEAMATAVHGAHSRSRATGRAVLVVHSGAGSLVPSIVDRMPDLIDGVVFVDATLPHSGQAWFDRAPPEMSEQLRGLVDADGFLPPWHAWFPAEVVRDLVPDAKIRTGLIAEMPRVPLAYFAEIAPALDAWTKQPCGYVQLSGAYDSAAAQARSGGWPVAHHEGHHLSAVTEPREVTNAILRLANDL